jgi:hypothetical protein
MSTVPVPLPHGILPLTLYDDTYSPTNFATSWLVEGLVDESLLRDALHRLTDKWRILSGRLEATDNIVNLKSPNT